MSDLTFTIFIALIAVAGAVTWVFLCRRGVVPEPLSKWSLAIGGAIIAFGLLPLFRVLFRKKEVKTKVVIVESVAPSEEEISATDEAIDVAVEAGERAIEKLSDIDARETVSRDLGDDDPGAGSIAAERLRKMRERTE